MSAIPRPVQRVLDAQHRAMTQKIAMPLPEKRRDVTRVQGEAVASLVERAANLGKAMEAGQRLGAWVRQTLGPDPWERYSESVDAPIRS